MLQPHDPCRHHHGPHPPFRRLHSRTGRQPRRRARPVLRFPRPQRRRQVHHHQDAHRPPRPHLRQHPDPRPRRPRQPHRGQTPDRRSPRRPRPLPPSHCTRTPPLRRPHARPRRRHHRRPHHRPPP